jgi:thioredoxin reductase (NADPH)
MHADVLVIGAGPIGLACAIACRKAGLTARVIDKGTLVNSLYQYPLNMTFFSTSEKLEIGDVPFISHLPKPNRDEALEYYRRVAMHWKLDIGLYEPAEEILRTDSGFIVQTPQAEYHSRAVVIATGFYDIPNLMGIPGEDLAKVHHYYREAHPYFGQDIVVVGAANSAVDVALETWRKGARVTMVIREPSIQDNVKYWVKPDIENRIRDGEIRAYFQSSLTAIRPREVDIRTPDGDITLFNDFVLAMTGYLPDFSLLERAGIQIGEDAMRTPVHDPETMETNVPGLYLAGVICGGLQTNKWFIENSREHAERIVEHFLSRRQLPDSVA